MHTSLSMIRRVEQRIWWCFDESRRTHAGRQLGRLTGGACAWPAGRSRQQQLNKQDALQSSPELSSDQSLITMHVLHLYSIVYGLHRVTREGANKEGGPAGDWRKTKIAN
jgi:hypothetical protein